MTWVRCIECKCGVYGNIVNSHLPEEIYEVEYECECGSIGIVYIGRGIDD